MTGRLAGEVAAVLAALHDSHERLTGAVRDLQPGRATDQSYDTGWSIAQVASHLGSGAEIFSLFIDAGVRGEPAPDAETFQPIWASWNAKAPTDQLTDALVADAELLDRVDAVAAEQPDAWRLELFGSRRTLAGLLRMRLAEHALHTWDITVVDNPRDVLPETAAEQIVDTLPWLVARAGKPSGPPSTIRVITGDPRRVFHLAVGPDAVSLEPALQAGSGSGSGGSELSLPAEAFVRLIYGRLDPDHTPGAVRANTADLDRLRATFPGI
jgi:uncharacterized protein (TIGR03083 family)